MSKRKYNYFYKTENKINNKFYYGVHRTDDLNDGYLGSGIRIQRAILKYGVENFNKEILKFFDTFEDALDYESEIVNEELLKDVNCYNLIKGGRGTSDIVTVKDKNNNTMSISINDPRYLSGELLSITVGTIVAKDKDGNIMKIDINDPRYLSGELVHHSKGTVTVKDKNNNYFNVNLNDPRYLSGKLKHIWSNKKHKEESKQKIGKTNSIKQKGEKNSQFGTCWIHNEKENKKIKKEELNDYINIGWIKGRKMKF